MLGIVAARSRGRCACGRPVYQDRASQTCAEGSLLSDWNRLAGRRLIRHSDSASLLRMALHDLVRRRRVSGLGNLVAGSLLGAFSAAQFVCGMGRLAES